MSERPEPDLDAWEKYLEWSRGSEVGAYIFALIAECRALRSRLSALEADKAVLRGALQRYGTHSWACACRQDHATPETGDCDCGLESALSSHPAGGERPT